MLAFIVLDITNPAAPRPLALAYGRTQSQALRAYCKSKPLQENGHLFGIDQQGRTVMLVDKPRHKESVKR